MGSRSRSKVIKVIYHSRECTDSAGPPPAAEKLRGDTSGRRERPGEGGGQLSDSRATAGQGLAPSGWDPAGRRHGAYPCPSARHIPLTQGSHPRGSQGQAEFGRVGESAYSPFFPTVAGGLGELLKDGLQESARPQPPHLQIGGDVTCPPSLLAPHPHPCEDERSKRAGRFGEARGTGAHVRAPAREPCSPSPAFRPSCGGWR